MFDYWNTFILAISAGVFLVTKSSQPRFHASVMLCMGVLGMLLPKIDSAGAWSVGFLVYIVLNIITLALSPLQLILLWYFSPKPEVDPGIVIHHEGDGGEDITVDIVAVHGLGSNPAWAWTWEDIGTGRKCMWLNDLLPKATPRARIMAYNHNSAWFRDAPVKTVRICGEQLLESLNYYRRLPQEVKRPIVFIGHSFGGIIIKQALVAAGEKNTDSTYQSIEDSMHGAIFLGVPHDGSRLTAWGTLLSYCTYWLGSSTELLEALQPGEGLLRELNRSFITSYGKRALVDFFELHKTKTFGIPLLLGVDAHSSTNAGIKRIPLEADHIGMNKFRSERHHNYELVLGQITRMVDGIEKERSENLSAEQKECLQSLYLDGSENRRETIEKSHRSTLQWVNDNRIILDWMECKSQLIWISGKPGSGKSTLSKYLLERIIQQKKPAAITSFFFNDRGSKLLNSEQGFLQALLYQLVEQKPSLSTLVPERKKDDTGKEVPLSLDSLRKTLLLILEAPEGRSAFLIIDAFDECGEECKEGVLRFVLGDLAKHSSHPQILITSRRHTNLEIHLKYYPKIRLEDMNNDDIHAYLSSEFEIFAGGRSPEFIEKLVKKAVDKAQGVFLWVKLVIGELKKGKMLVGTDQELEKALDSLPRGLIPFYDRILEGLDISVDTDSEERRMLEWVLFANRPLSVAEFRYAVAIGSQQPPADLASVEDIAVPIGRMEARIREYSGGFLEVKRSAESRYNNQREGNKVIDKVWSYEGEGEDLFVQFIHQSVKDFLLEKKLEAIGSTSTTTYLITSAKAHSHLARVCMTYLTFPDFDKEPTGNQEVLNFTFQGYATALWMTHASLAEKHESIAQMTMFGWPRRLNFQNWSSNYGRLFRYSSTGEFWIQPLSTASQIGLLVDVRYFLTYAEENKSYDRVTTVSWALIMAASEGHEEIVQLLLENSADVNAQGGHFGSALQAAASRGHEKIVQLLVEKGADVNAQEEHFRSALQAAAFEGNEKIVQLLLENGADINAQGEHFRSALQAAAFEGHEKIVQLLLKNGADINAQGRYYGSALQVAASGGHEKIVQLLFENGADINAQGGEYGSALQAAASEGHEKIVQLLFEKGADINAQGGEYGSALQAAAYRGHEKIVQLLFENGADINAQGGYYGSALQAAASGGHEKIVQLLLENGADINAQGRYYGSALQVAAFEGHEKIVQLLFENGADINAQGGKYGSALQAAAFEGHEKIVQLLFEKGADINAQGGYYGSALQAAAFEGHEKIVQLLLENGVDVNAQGVFESALEAAKYNGHKKIVQLLSENGADVNVQEGY